MPLADRVAIADGISQQGERPRWPRRAGLDGWLRRQVRRQQRVVTLEDALLGNRGTAYAVYRLRFFMLRCGCAAALHILRLTLLRFVFSHRAFLLTLVLHAAASFVGSFWWGTLEVLRGRVRRLAREAEARRIPAEIGRWLTLAVCLGCVTLLLPASWFAWGLVHGGRNIDALDLYVLVIAVRLGFDFVTLTFHSGVYAVRRVYRPLSAMVAVELAGFVAVLALWRWLGAWSFPIAMLLSGTLSTMFLFRYAARLYRLFGWFPLQLQRPGLTMFAEARSFGESVAAGAGYAVMKMDAFLMLALFRWHTDLAHDVSLFMLFVSVGPAVQAGFDWAQLLYFDLKRLSDNCVAALRRRYEQFAFRLAWLVGIVLWGLACLLATAIAWRNLGELYWLIGPFLIARALLAQAQIQAFSRRRYGSLLSSGALLLAAIVLLQAGLPSERAKLVGLAAASVLIAWLLRVRQQRSEEEDTRVLPVTPWLRRLAQIRDPVRIRSLRFSRTAEPLLTRAGSVAEWIAENHWRHQRLARRIVKQLRGGGAITIVHPGQVVWYETPAISARVSSKTLVSWAGGLIDAVARSSFEPNGLAALQSAREHDVLAGFLARKGRRAEASPHVDDVRLAFAKMLPQGTIYSPDDPVPALLRQLSWQERRSIFLEAVHFANHLRRSRRRCRFDVTSFSCGGELRLIFIAGRNCDRRQRAHWRTVVREWNVAAALAPAEAARGEKIKWRGLCQRSAMDDRSRCAADVQPSF